MDNKLDPFKSTAQLFFFFFFGQDIPLPVTVQGYNVQAVVQLHNWKNFLMTSVFYCTLYLV